jgi:hypothetical protein
MKAGGRAVINTNVVTGHWLLSGEPARQKWLPPGTSLGSAGSNSVPLWSSPAQIQDGLSAARRWGRFFGAGAKEEPRNHPGDNRFCYDERADPILIESSIEIAWDYLERTGELRDGTVAGRVLLHSIETMVVRGERRRLMLANNAIIEYQKFLAKWEAA